MTHYLISTCMPKGSFEYMMDLMLTTKFPTNKDYLKKHNLLMRDHAHANVRELRFFEIDISTPATDEFETFLSEWGFAPITRVPKKHFGFIIKYFFKIFYKLGDLALRLACGNVYQRWLKDLLPKHGYIYRVFSPMERRFPGELPKPYKVNMQFNQRNFIIGKIIEYPVGSYDWVQEKKAYVSKH